MKRAIEPYIVKVNQYNDDVPKYSKSIITKRDTDIRCNELPDMFHNTVSINDFKYTNNILIRW